MEPIRTCRLIRIQPAPAQAWHGREVVGAHLHIDLDDGRRAAVYAALMLPDGAGPHPAVIHCPGGGQTVDAADLAWWSDRGFACAALDWQCGFYPYHDPARKSCWPPGVVMQGPVPRTWSEAILPLAVQAVGGVIDWLETDARIASGRIGCTGISWGGYLSWLVGAYEPRIRAIVPTYGCGGLFAAGRGRDDSGAPLTEAYRQRCDPLLLADSIRTPVAYLGASNDFFGWPSAADALLHGVAVPTRRCWAPNLDHAVLPGQSALALAWMRAHLADGPELPAEPRWVDGVAVIDRSRPVEAVEEWWAPGGGDDDTRCWWPGAAPAHAGARLTVVRYVDGVCLSTPVLRQEPGPSDDLGDAWPDLRAGFGWHWCLGGTQLHGNRTEVHPEPDGGLRVAAERGDGFLFFGLGDPRWNRPGFAGLRLRLTGTPPGQTVTVAVRAARDGQRPEWSGRTTIGSDGTLLIDRTTAGLPPDQPWSEIFRVQVGGLPAPRFALRSIERLLRP